MTVRFGGLVSYHIGGGWGTETPNPVSDAPAYVIRGTDIPRVAVGDLHSVPLRFHRSSNLASRSLRAGDIVLEVSGGSKGQPVGRALYVTDELLARFDHPVMCASFCKLVRIDPDLAVPAYVFRDLQLGYRDGRLESFQVQSTGITNFKWKAFLEHFDVSLPPVRVQRRVAGVLTSMDDLIENNRRRIEVLEEMARAIYREWFVRFRFPGHQAARLVSSELGLTPEGWDLTAASDVLQINPRIKLDKGVSHPFINMGDLSERGMSCRPSEYRSGGSGSKFVVGDTLFSRITPCLQNGKTGLVQTLGDSEVGRGSTEFIVLRGRLVGSAYTYCLARNERFRAHAEASMSGASGRQRVRNECFDSYLIAVPPRELAQQFEQACQPMFEQIRILTDEMSTLVRLRDQLLPKLVTGQIDVSGLDLEAVDAKEEAR